MHPSSTPNPRFVTHTRVSFPHHPPFCFYPPLRYTTSKTTEGWEEYAVARTYLLVCAHTLFTPLYLRIYSSMHINLLFFSCCVRFRAFFPLPFLALQANGCLVHAPVGQEAGCDNIIHSNLISGMNIILIFLVVRVMLFKLGDLTITRTLHLELRPYEVRGGVVLGGRPVDRWSVGLVASQASLNDYDWFYRNRGPFFTLVCPTLRVPPHLLGSSKQKS